MSRSVNVSMSSAELSSITEGIRSEISAAQRAYGTDKVITAVAFILGLSIGRYGIVLSPDGPLAEELSPLAQGYAAGKKERDAKNEADAKHQDDAAAPRTVHTIEAAMQKGVAEWESRQP